MISLLLFIPPVVTALYDLIYGWFVQARFELRTLQQWWNALHPGSLDMARDFLSGATSAHFTDKIFSWPACADLAVPPVVLYVLYLLIFRLKGGDGGSNYKFKSRH